MFCANIRELERLDPKECGAVHAADAVNERAKEIFTLPTAAHFHWDKIPNIRFLVGKYMKINENEWKREDGIEIAKEVYTKR